MTLSKVVDLLCLTVEGPGQGPCVVAPQRSTLCPWNVAAGSLLDFVGILPVTAPPCHCHLCTGIMKKAITTSKQMARSPQLSPTPSSCQCGPSSGFGTQDAGPRNPHSPTAVVGLA